MGSDCLLLTLPQGLDRQRIDGWRHQLFDLGEGEEQGYHRAALPGGSWEDIHNLTLRARAYAPSVWYRASFPHPGWPERTLLRFDGAFTAANVWLNGKLLGSHYGYPGGWGFDVSSFLQDQNLVAVCVQSPGDDSNLPPGLRGLTDGDGSWWPLGLIGKVWLERLGNVAVQTLEASWRLSAGQAEARISTTLINLDARPMELTVGWMLLPPEEEAPPQGFGPRVSPPPVARWRRNAILDGHQSVTLDTAVAVDRPELWWPWTLGEQRQYSLVVQVDSGSRSTTALREVGIREVNLDPAPGGLAWTVNGQRHFPRGAVLPPLPPGIEGDPIGAWRMAGLDLALSRGQLPGEDIAASADAAGVLLVVDPPPPSPGRARDADRDSHRAEAIALLSSHASAAVLLERGEGEPFHQMPAASSTDEPYSLTPPDRAEVELVRRSKYEPLTALVLTALPDIEEAQGALAPTTALLDVTRMQDRQSIKLRFHVINDDAGVSGAAAVRWRLREIDPKRSLFARDRGGQLEVRIPPPDQAPAVYEDDLSLPRGAGPAVIEVGLEKDGELLSYLEYSLGE